VELVFQYCDGVADVSELGRVKKMEIRYCRNLHDLSGLSTVHTLAVSLVPENLLPSLNQNTVLNLSYFLTDCYSIQFLEGNKLLRELNISGLKYIQDISMLNTVEVLNISNCCSIRSLTGLTALKELDMTGVDGVESGFEVFQQLTALTIGKVIRFKRITQCIRKRHCLVFAHTL
jgi:hypothetical protein